MLIGAESELSRCNQQASLTGPNGLKKIELFSNRLAVCLVTYSIKRFF